MNLNVKIPKIFKPLFNGELKDYRIISYYGGRGGGKTYALTYFFIIKCLQQKNLKIVVAREIKESRQDSIVSIFSRFITKYNLNNFVNSNSNSISFVNGSKILFRGVSKQTIENIRGIDDVDYFWFDEAHNIDKETMGILIPSIRSEKTSPQIFLTFNVVVKSSYLFDYLQTNKNNGYAYSLKVNYYDNPFFSDYLDKDRLNDYETLPRELYLEKWEGELSSYNELKVIDIDKIGFFDDSKKYDYKYIIISIDTATSTKTGADYSAIGIFGLCKDSQDVHLIHLRRGHWDWWNLLENIKAMYNACNDICLQSANLILIEAKANGLNVIQELQRTTNLRVKGTTPIVDKLSRVTNNFLPFIKNLKLPQDKTNIKNFWINDYLFECSQFRADCKHEHDDMIDCTSQALEFLLKKTFNYDTIKQAFNSVNF